MRTSLSRRSFLEGSLGGLSLIVAVLMTPRGFRLVQAGELKKNSSQNIRLGSWIEITPDNRIVIIVSQSEMGQGVYTSMPMIVADELEADWKQVRSHPAPARDEYKNPIFKMQLTGGSTSVRHRLEQLRKAGAAAREMLLMAAAETWKTAREECEAFQGTIRHKASGRSLTFGQLVKKAATLPVPQDPPLKKENQFRLIGQPLPRLDTPVKVQGLARFGLDVQMPDLLYAVVARPPVYGAKVVSFNQKVPQKVPGVTRIVTINRGIAVCAKTPWQAWRGREALNLKWGDGSHPKLDTGAVEKIFLESLAKAGINAKNKGDAKKVLDQAAKKAEAVYQLPYLAHTTMEPMNCTAHVQKERCDIWVPTQFQTAAQQMGAKLTGLKPDRVFVHTTFLGGGFGRRSEVDVVEEAVQISHQVKKPIKVIWTREEDIQYDFYRPGNCCLITAGLDEAGRLLAWSHKVVTPSIFTRVFPSMMKNGIDPAAVEGIEDTPYEIPNLNVEYTEVDLPIPVGFWRSVGNSHNAFTMECFMDEMAHLAQRDPLEFRLGLLKSHKRAARVLEVAAEKAGWGKPLTRGQGRGIAQHHSFGSYVAQVAEISLDKKEGAIQVHRVVCVLDCGLVVNPNTVMAQMEGAIIMGLSAALKEKVEFIKGGVKTANFDEYPLIRMKEIPEIEVHIIKSNDPPGGIGEPGLPPIAPAVANALFAAAGIRLRRLPMSAGAILEALDNK